MMGVHEASDNLRGILTLLSSAYLIEALRPEALMSKEKTEENGAKHA